MNLVVPRLPERVQFLAELFALIIAAGLIGYATYFMGALVAESLHYGDVSNGIIPVPLCVPQSVAACGIGLLLVAVIHTLLELLVALTIFFIILGCFLDGISVIVLTTSIIMPMVSAVGIDPIWFGIYLVIVVEMSQITPPVGFNLFVIQGLMGSDILRIATAAFPFFLLLLLGVFLICLFPQIVTFLPAYMAR